MSYVDFKEIYASQPGTTNSYGSDNLSELFQILNNKIIPNRRLSIKNPIRFTDNIAFEAPAVLPANPAAGRLLLVNPTGGALSILKPDGTIINLESLASSNSAFPLQANYIIYNDAGTYKAKNGLTGAVHATTSATNVAAVINAVIDELTTATGGGMVFITKGIFTQTTSIIMKDKIHLVGAGQSVTILKLANNTAIDQIESFNFASLTNTNSLGGVGQVTIRDLTIDGNRVNQSGAGGMGIKKYGWRWFLQNVIIKNTKKSGIYSEWSTNAGFPTGGEDEGMDDHWLNVTVAGCHATDYAVVFRGPHDSLIEGLYIAWAPNAAGMKCEGNTNYDGNCRIIGAHIYSIKPETQALYVTGAGGTNTLVSITQSDIEGANGTGGVGLLVDGSAQVKANDCQIYLNTTGVLFSSSIPCSLHNCRIFQNTTGVKLQTSQHFVTGCLWISNDIGVLVQSISGGLNLNRIDGHFKGHTTGAGIAIDLHDVADLTYVNATVVDAIKGIVVGRSGQSVINCIINLQAYNCTTAAIDWADASNADNTVNANIFTAAAGHAVISGSPNYATNDITIKSSGSSTSLRNTPRKGATASVTDGGTITHGCGTTPRLVKVSPSVASEMASVTALGATTFTVAIKKHDNTAGTSQTIYWEAFL